MNFLKKHFGILSVLVLAVVLRLIVINLSLWLDEAIGALVVRDMSMSEIVTNFMKFDNHPPLYYMILKLWTDFFGYSEVALRLPSIIFGVGTIWFAYKIHTVFIKTSKLSMPLFLALLLATSQLHIYYSQEARMYSMAAFFATLSSYLFLKTRISNKLTDWIGFSISCLFITFSDYLPIIMLPTYFIFALLNIRGVNWWKKFIASFIPSVVVFMFWLPTFLIQSQKGKWLLMTVPKWREVAGGANFKQVALVWMKFVFGRVTFDDKNLYYLIVIIVSIPFILLLLRMFNKKIISNFYFYWLSIPLLIGFFLSLTVPAFNYFRFLFILPAFYGITVQSLEQIDSVKLRNIFVVIFITINLLSCLLYFTKENNQREDWKGSIAFVENKVSKNEVILFSYPEPFAPYEWYMKNKISFGATDSILATDKSVEITNRLIKDSVGIYYFEYLSGLSDPFMYVQKAIIDNDFELKNIYNFNGVGLVYYYSK